MILKSLFVSFLLFLQVTVFGQNQLDTISAYEASALIGQEVIMKAKVVSVFYARNSNGEPTFLNLEEFYPNNPVVIVIFKKELDILGIDAESYIDKTILVKGKLELYKDETKPYTLKPNIIITRKNQILIIEQK